jgi:hypothetical protein
LEVETPHGKGIVLYVTVHGPHMNDVWCVANLKDGQLRHYQTCQLSLSENGMVGVKKEEKP